MSQINQKIQKSSSGANPTNFSNKTVSIIIPVYNEELSLNQLYKELEQVTRSLKDYHFEILFVDDGSTDQSGKILEKFAQNDKNIKIITFSRNFGKNAATRAGIDFANGDAVIVMDADLQHPPSLIPKFIQEWQNGTTVVIGRRKKMEGETWTRKLGSISYHKIMNIISGMDSERGATDFRLLDKKAVDEIRKMPEKVGIFRAIVDWLGFEKKYVDFVAPKSNKRNSSFSLISLFKLAMESITSHSLFPLKLAGYLGLFISTGSGLLLFIMLYTRFILGNEFFFSPLAFIVVSNVFLSGLMLVCLGLIAIYIGGIYEEIKGRRLYVIKKTINI